MAIWRILDLQTHSFIIFDIYPGSKKRLAHDMREGEKIDTRMAGLGRILILRCLLSNHIKLTVFPFAREYVICSDEITLTLSIRRRSRESKAATEMNVVNGRNSRETLLIDVLGKRLPYLRLCAHV